MTKDEVDEAADQLEKLIERATLAVAADQFAVAESLMAKAVALAKTLPQKLRG
jgi:phage shock protein A